MTTCSTCFGCTVDDPVDLTVLSKVSTINTVCRWISTRKPPSAYRALINWDITMVTRRTSDKFLTLVPPQAQLQDAKRRWEELQNFLHNVNTEREKLQASNQGE